MLRQIIVVGLALLPCITAPVEAQQETGADAQSDDGGVTVPAMLNAISPDGDNVNVTHGPIPDIGWPAMTMDLGLGPDAEIGTLGPDDPVMMTLDRDEQGMYRIRELRAGDDLEASTVEALQAARARTGGDGGGDHSDHHDHAMTMDMEGMVMNENANELPQDCAEISGDHEFAVHAGHKYALAHAGTMFGYDQNVFRVPACARITVTLVNDDQIRHQWMVHGLPRYLYQQGMFHLEAVGGAQKTGTFIVPSTPRTYLIHCDIAQHMEMGMKGQLVVAGGDGDLPSIPGVSGARRPDNYRPGGSSWRIVLACGIAACVAAAILAVGTTVTKSHRRGG